jgi:hypothetical protein
VLLGSLAAAALLLVLGRWGSGLYTDYLWFASLGAESVWRARTATTLILGTASFAAASAFAFLNLYAVRQSVVSLVLPRRIANIEIGEEVPSRYLFLATCGLSMVLGAALTLPSATWTQALLARVGRPFGESDPYFGADLGFFVYWLPLETALYVWAMIVLVVVIAVVLILYSLTPSLKLMRGSLYVSAYVRRHFTMLGGVLLIALAWSYRLDMYRLLADGGGAGGAFTAVDHRVSVPATLLLSLVTLCAAVIVAWAGWSGQLRLAFFAVSAVLLLSLVARTVAPLVARRSADPVATELQERPYMATRLSYTRRAYGVDRMRAETLGTGFTSVAELARRTSVWDGATLARAAERSRDVRAMGSSVAWTASPEGLAALLVERGSAASGEGSDLWDIGRFSAGTSDENGLPVRLESGTGPDAGMVLEEPAVYDGAPEYSVLSDSAQGIAGVEMVSTRSRLAHAWSLQNFRLLFGELPLNRPTIVRRRDVRLRVRALAPFFVQGSDVLPVVAADSLYWAVELYAASGEYPLARRFPVLNEMRGYFQHAATALVHARSGRVRLVLAPSPEPVTESWAARFPQIFIRSTALPNVVQTALPPISDGARAQALAFAVAGFRGDSLEVRHFATPDAGDSAASREPVHADLPSLGVSALWPLLDAQERVRGVVAAIGGVSRGTAWIPLASDGQRWGSTIDRLATADSGAREAGTVRTPVRVAPVGGRPAYFQASFRGRPGASPSLNRVTAIVKDTVRAAPSLSAALGISTPVAGGAGAEPRDGRARLEMLHRAMREALRRGDWTSFGSAFDSLGAALRAAPR